MSDTQAAPWSDKRRLMWRVQFAALVITITGGLLAGLGYMLTRASVADLNLKADKTEIQRLDGRLDTLGSLTNNVRDNLIVLMTKQKADPVPLPVAPLTQPVLPAVRP